MESQRPSHGDQRDVTPRQGASGNGRDVREIERDKRWRQRHRQAGRKSDRESDGPGGRGTQTLCTREGVITPAPGAARQHPL